MHTCIHAPYSHLTLEQTWQLRDALLLVDLCFSLLQDMVEHFKGTPTVFLGSLKGKELAAAYASADIFCMPSETETLGNVVGEVSQSDGQLVHGFMLVGKSGGQGRRVMECAVGGPVG